VCDARVTQSGEKTEISATSQRWTPDSFQSKEFHSLSREVIDNMGKTAEKEVPAGAFNLVA
jgi:hypothetical protein